MNKAYSRINWQNSPSISTPINETNMNAMDEAIDTIDNRVVALDGEKVSQIAINPLVKNITIDTTTGLMTVTHENGTYETTNLSNILSEIGLISSETIEFETVEYSTYYFDYPENSSSYGGITVYTPTFEMEDGSTNGYMFYRFYENGNALAILIDGNYVAVYDENGEPIKDDGTYIDSNIVYIITYDTTAEHKLQVIATKEPGSLSGTTGYVKNKSLKVEHCSDELIEFIKKNGSGALAGLADYFVEVPFGIIGIFGVVDEYHQLPVEND